MKAIHLDMIGDFGFSENTAKEYDNQITYEDLAVRLGAISNAVQCGSGYVCYVMGMGAHQKSTYNNISTIDGVEVIWVGSVLPKLLKFLSVMLPSYAGLVKVSDRKCIEGVFTKLVDHSMAGIYVFPTSYEREFLEKVRRNAPPLAFDFGVKSCKDYFMYIVDADNTESATGIYELVSYGLEAAPDLIDAFDDRSPYGRSEVLH